MRDDHTEEYEAVRREIGRLTQKYREVAVRHYVHGHSVERIARELELPRGTVLSRLSFSRSQIREGIKAMEKYSRVSYEPKHMTIGIRGGDSMCGEPFRLLHSPIEMNLLILAYEKPVSVRELADTMGIPSAYLEPIIDMLINGELMGRTSGGLIYTRMFLQNAERSSGNILMQEELAKKYSQGVWERAWRRYEPLTKRDSFAAMNDKQKATFVLMMLERALTEVCFGLRDTIEYKDIPERPNGGKWLAIGTVYENEMTSPRKYAASGPVQITWQDKKDNGVLCRMYDMQSLFGDTHWRYGDRDYFSRNYNYNEILRLYASLTPCDVKPHNDSIYSEIPGFEKLHIIKRDKDGKAVLDIPSVTFEEEKLWIDANRTLGEELSSMLVDELRAVMELSKNSVPKHVDMRDYFVYEGALGAYVMAQLVAVVENGLLPYPVTVGETPLIYVVYRETK